jgi:hypothetical protein
VAEIRVNRAYVKIRQIKNLLSIQGRKKHRFAVAPPAAYTNINVG